MLPATLNLCDPRQDNLVDLFCGCGGSGGGLLEANEILGRDVQGTFVNHWDMAIKIHQENHPEHRHMVEDLFTLDPTLIFPVGTHCSLLWASPQCFPSGTLVTTSTGQVCISKVRKGDSVLTHKGRWRKVVATSRSVADTVKLKGHGHYGLETTAEHPFYSKRITKRYDGRKNGKRRGAIRTLVENPYWEEAASMVDKLWATPTVAESLPLPMDHGMLPDREFYYMIGRWLGDGSYSKGDLTICCGHHETEDLRKLLSAVRYADGTQVEWREDPVGTAHTFFLGNAALVRFMKREFGEGAKGKNVAAWVYGLPVLWRNAVVAGYLGADGHTPSAARNSCMSVSKSLAVSMRILLSSAFAVSLHHSVSRETKIVGRVIKGGSDNYTLAWQPDCQKETSFTDSRHRFSFCRSVDAGSKSVAVYNLQVEEDESYVADGIVVHNCTFFSIARGASCVNEQDRSHAHSVTDWVIHLNPEALICENVKEFVDWSPVIQARHDGELVWTLGAKPARDLPPALRRKKRESEDKWAIRMREAGYKPYEVPDKTRKGEYFKAWLQTMIDLGYDADYQLLKSADYGDPTIRTRLFVYFVRRDSGKKIVWPDPYAGEKGTNHARPMNWRVARDIIQWELKGESVFTRGKNLASNTFRRLAIGLTKYGLKEFLISSAHGSPKPGDCDRRVHSLDDPLGTLTAKGDRGVVEAVGEFLIPNFGERDGQTPRTHDVDAPLPTVTSHGVGGIVSTDMSYMVPHHTGGKKDWVKGVDTPVSTVTATMRGEGLAQASIIQMKGQSTAQSVDSPLTALTACQSHYLSSHEVTMVDHLYGAGVAAEVDEPLRAVTSGGGHHGLAEAFMFAIDQTGGTKRHDGTYPIDAPVRTIVTKANQTFIEMQLEELSDRFTAACAATGVDTSRAEEFLRHLVTELQRRGVVDAKPWIYVYYSNGSEGKAIDEPLPTVRTKAGHALVYPVIELHGKMIRIDLFYRMLTPLELQRAMGFPDDMKWSNANKTEQIRAIGNSVSRGVSCALGLAWYSQNPNVWDKVRHNYE